MHFHAFLASHDNPPEYRYMFCLVFSVKTLERFLGQHTRA